MTSSNLLILAATLLLTPSHPFMPILPTKPSRTSLYASPEEPNSRLNQDTLNTQPSRLDNGMHNKFIDEPTDDLPSNDSSTQNDEPTSMDHTRALEFDLEPIPRTHSPRHQARLDMESRLKSIYTPVNSNEYWELQDEILQLESDLEVAKSQLSSRRGEESSGVQAIETMLRRRQAKDAMHVYRITTQAARVAERMGRMEEAKRYEMESGRAKKMLPQFNLEGLWVGK